MPRVNAAGSVGVEVDGLAELNRALREIGPDAQKRLKGANLEVAREVADDAEDIALGLGGVAAKSAPSIRAAARNTAAGVTIGSAAYPFALGAEFGGQRRPTTQQFKPWRGNGPQAGYFVYEAVRRDADEIVRLYDEAIAHVLRENGLA